MTDIKLLTRSHVNIIPSIVHCTITYSTIMIPFIREDLWLTYIVTENINIKDKITIVFRIPKNYIFENIKMNDVREATKKKFFS